MRKIPSETEQAGLDPATEPKPGYSAVNQRAWAAFWERSGAYGTTELKRSKYLGGSSFRRRFNLFVHRNQFRQTIAAIAGAANPTGSGCGSRYP